MAHKFNFFQGELFSRMGASWFVSYCYDDVVPAQLGDWNHIKSAPSRISIYNRTKWWGVDTANGKPLPCDSENNLRSMLRQNARYVRLHKYWMQKVLQMNAKKINRNSIGLNYTKVNQMARVCIPLL